MCRGDGQRNRSASSRSLDRHLAGIGARKGRIAEPFFLHRRLQARSKIAPESIFALIERLHWALLSLGAITILGAVAGSHGLLFFGGAYSDLTCINAASRNRARMLTAGPADGGYGQRRRPRRCRSRDGRAGASARAPPRHRARCRIPGRRCCADARGRPAPGSIGRSIPA